MKKSWNFGLAFFILLQGAFAQGEKSDKEIPKLLFSGFLDLYYFYDFNQAEADIRQPFFYNHNRHNQVNGNLIFGKVSLSHSAYRANLALHAGTYVTDNYAKEPDWLKMFQEANFGVALNSKQNLWLDAGIFNSHIGFESAISIDNWTLTRSLLAENSPYFETGVKLTFSPNEKWELATMVLTGWQRIQAVKGNSLPSFGTQVKFFPSNKILVNWSSFLGTEDPDEVRRIRFFNNFYGQFQLTERLGMIGGFDVGIQQKERESSDYDSWIAPIVIAQYTIHRKLKAGFRAEYYQDRSGVIISVQSPEGFQTSGLSLNLDYSPVPNLSLRVESRWLKSPFKVLGSGNNLSEEDFFIGTSIAFKTPQKK